MSERTVSVPSVVVMGAPLSNFDFQLLLHQSGYSVIGARPGWLRNDFAAAIGWFLLGRCSSGAGAVSGDPILPSSFRLR
jgi:hypothetical protein